MSPRRYYQTQVYIEPSDRTIDPADWDERTDPEKWLPKVPGEYRTIRYLPATAYVGLSAMPQLNAWGEAVRASSWFPSVSPVRNTPYPEMSRAIRSNLSTAPILKAAWPTPPYWDERPDISKWAPSVVPSRLSPALEMSRAIRMNLSTFPLRTNWDQTVIFSMWAPDLPWRHYTLKYMSQAIYPNLSAFPIMIDYLEKYNITKWRPSLPDRHYPAREMSRAILPHLSVAPVREIFAEKVYPGELMQAPEVYFTKRYMTAAVMAYPTITPEVWRLSTTDRASARFVKKKIRTRF